MFTVSVGCAVYFLLGDCDQQHFAGGSKQLHNREFLKQTIRTYLPVWTDGRCQSRAVALDALLALPSRQSQLKAVKAASESLHLPCYAFCDHCCDHSRRASPCATSRRRRAVECFLISMADVLALLQEGLTTLGSGQVPDVGFLKVLVSRVRRGFLRAVRLAAYWGRDATTLPTARQTRPAFCRCWAMRS